jgi:uncharacterized protein YoxC
MSAGAHWAIAVVILINTLFLVGIAVALWLLNARVNEALGKVQPLLDTSAKTLQNVEQLTVLVSERVHRVLDRTSEVVEEVSRSVENTTARAEATLSQPLIGAASLMAGINQGLSAYQGRPEKGE